MNITILLLETILILAIVHVLFVLTFNRFINPHESSTFTKIFPYEFIYNKLFSKHKTKKPYFSLRVDINTSRENVKEHDEGLIKLIKLANDHNIPITFSIASEYIPALSGEVKELISEPQHEIISHSHTHSDLTKEDQSKQIKKSKQRLEESFNKEIKGLVAPQAKHDLNTLKAAKQNNIKYLSSGSLSYIRYWSFPYPFKKQNIWLIGGGIPSDHYLYHQKNRSPNEALTIWKNALQFRMERNWFTQLEYHNFSTSEKELDVLKELFKYIKNSDIEPIKQSELIDKIS